MYLNTSLISYEVVPMGNVQLSGKSFRTIRHLRTTSGYSLSPLYVLKTVYTRGYSIEEYVGWIL